MGIQGLQGFLKANGFFWDTQELCDCQLVIDANNLLVSLYCSNCYDNRSPRYRDDIHGGDLVRYAKELRMFFSKLAKCKIEPLLVSDGANLVASTSQETSRLFEAARAKSIEYLEAARLISEHNPNSGRAMNLCLNQVFQQVFNELKLERVRSAYGADNYAAKLANELKCPAVSSDSDFAILPISEGVILVEALLGSRPQLASDGSSYILRCPVFKQSRLFAQFPGLDSAKMPLFGVLFSSNRGQRSPFEHLLRPTRNQYQGRLIARSERHRKFADLLAWLARQASFEAALEQLCSQDVSLKQQIRGATNDCHTINESQDIISELERLYPPAKYSAETDKQPAHFINGLVSNGGLPGTMMDIIFQKPYFGKAVVDDLQLAPSGRVRLRPFSVAIALLRPLSQAEQSATGDEPAGLPSSGWTFDVYDRTIGSATKCSELVQTKLKALTELEGFGSLRGMHIGLAIEMDLQKKLQLLLATFRCNEKVFGQIGDLAADLFAGKFKNDAQCCSMLIRYCAIESKVKPMRAFVEAVLITLLHYCDEPVGDGELATAQLTASALALDDGQQADEADYRQASSQYRRIMHFISQLTAASWSFVAINSLLGQPLQVLQLHKFLDCPLMYKLTRKLGSGRLNFEEALASSGATSLASSVDSLVGLVAV